MGGAETGNLRLVSLENRLGLFELLFPIWCHLAQYITSACPVPGGDYSFLAAAEGAGAGGEAASLLASRARSAAASCAET